MKPNVRRYVSGFTLIELMLVIAIIGIISTIGLISFVTSIQKGRDAERKSDLSTIAKGLEEFKNDFGVYPSDKDVASGQSNIIEGCMSQVSDIGFSPCPASGKFQYFKNGENVVVLEKFPVDPVDGRSYLYQHVDASSTNEESFSLYASLENIQDKDVKKKLVSGVLTPDPKGWTDQYNASNSLICGNAGSDICNYRVTESGLVTQ